MIDFDEWYEKENAIEIQKYQNLLKEDLSDTLRAKLERWLRMLKGDEKALIELSIEWGLATAEDFADYEVADEDRL